MLYKCVLNAGKIILTYCILEYSTVFLKKITDYPAKQFFVPVFAAAASVDNELCCGK